MNRFPHISLFVFLLILVTSGGIAQSRTTTGIITTYAGIGSGIAANAPGCTRFNPCDTGNGFSGDGGPAISARLFDPYGVAVDPAGNLLIADTNNNRIRKVTPEGAISTVAGDGRNGFGGDGGLATSAQLSSPQAIAVDLAGNSFIADYDNNRIRKITPDGRISTAAGNGMTSYSGDGGPATSAGISRPLGVAVDVAGNLFIADSNDRIRKVTTDGVISTVAGNGARGFSGDGGPAASAQLHAPFGIAVDLAGNLFIADTYNSRIRKVTPDGVISTIAGIHSYGLAVDARGDLFIADTFNRQIRMITRDGVISTIAGSSERGISGDGGLARAGVLDGASPQTSPFGFGGFACRQ